DLLTVYGPQGIKEYIETSLKISRTHLTYPLEIIEFTEGIIFKDDLFKVTAFPLAHGIPSYGFRIEEADKLGELNVEALKNAGSKAGPTNKQIKSEETKMLNNGA